MENKEKSKPSYDGLYGYESAVFYQKGYEKVTNLTNDTLCIVPNTKEYLLADLNMNPQNYSKYQKKFILSKDNKIIKGPNDIVFFTGASSHGYPIKRGFIQLSDALTHTLLGNTWYSVWRFQKPLYSFKSTYTLDNTVIQISRKQDVLMGLLTLENEKIPFMIYIPIYMVYLMDVTVEMVCVKPR